MEEKLISIIIVNFNGKKWLKKCFDSLLEQTHKDFEIIFIDNNSSDHSINFIKDNFNDKRIKIIKNDENKGFAEGNNLGIKYSIGKYILFLNNDTWVEPDFLEKILTFYQNNNYNVIAPREKDYMGNKKNRDLFWTLDPLGHFAHTKEVQKAFYLPGVCLFFKKDFYLETGGLDNDFFMYVEETDWFWRLNLLKKNFSYANDVFVYHAGAGSTGEGVKYHLFLWRNQNTLQMLLKNYSAFNLLWVLLLYFLQNIFEIIFFLVILKPKISFSYIQGWWFNIINIRKILLKRSWVQKNRLVSDFQIIKKMYFGSGKLKHLISFYKE